MRGVGDAVWSGPRPQEESAARHSCGACWCCSRGWSCYPCTFLRASGSSPGRGAKREICGCARAAPGRGGNRRVSSATNLRRWARRGSSDRVVCRARAVSCCGVLGMCGACSREGHRVSVSSGRCRGAGGGCDRVEVGGVPCIPFPSTVPSCLSFSSAAWFALSSRGGARARGVRHGVVVVIGRGGVVGAVAGMAVGVGVVDFDPFRGGGTWRGVGVLERRRESGGRREARCKRAFSLRERPCLGGRGVLL